MAVSVERATLPHPTVVTFRAPDARARRGAPAAPTAASRAELPILRTLIDAARLRPAVAWSAVERLAVSAPPGSSADALAGALLTLLRLGARRAITLHAAQAATLSLDECWLAQLLDAARRDDEASLRALVAFRLDRAARRPAIGLARRLASALDRLSNQEEGSDGPAVARPDQPTLERKEML